MPRIYIQTLVETELADTWQGFDSRLFLALAPPLVPLQLLRFDGCMPGDEIHLDTGLWPLRQHWESRVSEQHSGTGQIWFVDEGIRMPWGIRDWRHKHLLIREGSGTRIVDDIRFGLKSKLLWPFLYPALFLVFYLRKPLYQRYFRKSKPAGRQDRGNAQNFL